MFNKAIQSAWLGGEHGCKIELMEVTRHLTCKMFSCNLLWVLGGFFSRISQMGTRLCGE